MITGKTRSGFEFEVNEEIVKDWRVAKAMAAAGSKDEQKQLGGVVELVSVILGDQEEALCATLRDENGIVKTQDIIDNVSDILNALSRSGENGKN